MRSRDETAAKDGLFDHLRQIDRRLALLGTGLLMVYIVLCLLAIQVRNSRGDRTVLNPAK